MHLQGRNIFSKSLPLVDIFPGFLKHEFTGRNSYISNKHPFLWKLLHEVIEALVELTKDGRRGQTNIIEKQFTSILHSELINEMISRNAILILSINSANNSEYEELITWALRPIFCNFSPFLKPGVPASTKNRLMPWAADLDWVSVTATTMTTSLR